MFGPLALLEFERQHRCSDSPTSVDLAATTANTTFFLSRINPTFFSGPVEQLGAPQQNNARIRGPSPRQCHPYALAPPRVWSTVDICQRWCDHPRSPCLAGSISPHAPLHKPRFFGGSPGVFWLTDRWMLALLWFCPVSQTSRRRNRQRGPESRTWHRSNAPPGPQVYSIGCPKNDASGCFKHPVDLISCGCPQPPAGEQPSNRGAVALVMCENFVALRANSFRRLADTPLSERSTGTSRLLVSAAIFRVRAGMECPCNRLMAIVCQAGERNFLQAPWAERADLLVVTPCFGGVRIRRVAAYRPREPIARRWSPTGTTRHLKNCRPSPRSPFPRLRSQRGDCVDNILVFCHAART